MPEESHEKIVAEMASDIDRENAGDAGLRPVEVPGVLARGPRPSSSRTSPGSSVSCWNLEPGQENDYHMHPTTEHLHVVVAGEVEYTLADREPMIVKAGQAVIVPEKVAHGIRNVGTSRASYVAITSPGDYQKVLVERPS